MLIVGLVAIRVDFGNETTFVASVGTMPLYIAFSVQGRKPIAVPELQ